MKSSLVSVLLVKRLLKFMKWKQTTLLHGYRVEKPMRTIASCCVRDVIGKNLLSNV